MKRTALLRKTSLLGLAAGAALVAAFGGLRPAPAAGADGAPAAVAATADGAGNPMATLSRAAQDLAPLAGRVEERLSAGSYAYHAVRLEDGRLTWVVTLGQGHPAGAQVKVRSMGRRADFRSNRLQRTFPELVFGIVSRVN